MTDLLIGTGELGRALSAALGENAVVPLARPRQRSGWENSAAGCLSNDSNTAQRPAAASGDDAGRAFDLNGAGGSNAKVKARSGPDAIQIGRTWELWKERSRRQ